MFKRLIIGLVAVGLVVIFMTEAANALVFRGRNTVVNTHICNEFLSDGITPDLCWGADLVSDTLYGYDVSGQKASCVMTGTVVCEKDTGGICTDATNEAFLSIDSFKAGATFVTETRTAQDHTVLPDEVGQGVCETEFPTEGTIFSRFWPNVAVAVSVYIDNDTKFPNLEGDQTTYELIELCTIMPGGDLYDCDTLWDSSPDYAGVERPKLPCCGEINTLTVQIAGGVGGTVTSSGGNQDPNANEPADIDCPVDCEEIYDGTTPPYDGCPEVVLTATPDSGLSGYEFTGWSGGGCSGTGTCTPSVKDSPTITATFEASYHTLTVIVTGDDKGRAWIFQPRSDFDDPATFYCYDTCTKKFGDTGEFAIGEFVVIKRKGATFEEWGGDCAGTPNSSDTCTVEMNVSRTIEVRFAP